MFIQRGGVCNGTDIVILNFMLDLLSRINDKDKQQVCGNSFSGNFHGLISAHSLIDRWVVNKLNHEKILHFRFRTLTMQMCCWIVDLNYLTL